MFIVDEEKPHAAYTHRGGDRGVASNGDVDEMHADATVGGCGI